MNYTNSLPDPAIWTIERKGRFVPRVFGLHHCAIAESDTHTPIDYHVRIRVTRDSLDSRGFLVDNMLIHRFFTDLESTDLSCEHLAGYCAEKLHAAVREENPGLKPIGMMVALSPVLPDGFGEAAMSFQWGDV